MGVYNSTRTVSPSPSLSPQMGVYNSTVSPSQKAQEYELEALAWIFMLEIIVTFLYPLVTSMSLLICMNNFVTFLVWMYLDEEEDDIHKHEAVFLDLIASTACLVSGIVFSLSNKGESESIKSVLKRFNTALLQDKGRHRHFPVVEVRREGGGDWVFGPWIEYVKERHEKDDVEEEERRILERLKQQKKLQKKKDNAMKKWSLLRNAQRIMKLKSERNCISRIIGCCRKSSDRKEPEPSTNGENNHPGDDNPSKETLVSKKQDKYPNPDKQRDAQHQPPALPPDRSPGGADREPGAQKDIKKYEKTEKSKRDYRKEPEPPTNGESNHPGDDNLSKETLVTKEQGINRNPNSGGDKQRELKKQKDVKGSGIYGKGAKRVHRMQDDF